MRKLILLSFFLIIAFAGYSQNPRIFKSIRHSYFSEFLISPIGIEGYGLISERPGIGSYKILFDKDNSIYVNYGNNFTMTIYNYIYTFRYNLKEYSNEFSLGLNFSPAIGFSPSEFGGIGILNIPGYLTFNFGDGSTKKSDKIRGWYFGIGYEYSVIDLIKADSRDYYIKSITATTGQIYKVDGCTNHWGEPMLIFGLRWGGSRYFELAFKYGFNPFYKNPTEAFIPWAQSYQLSLGKAMFL